MKKRKPISKKLRFEIFKRDGFQCAYCGNNPPAVTLEIDHIEPFSKGGACDINNYITACFDCNRGKRDIPLDKIPSKLIDTLEALKTQEEQLKEYKKFVRKIQRREKKDIADVAKVYSETFFDFVLTSSFKNRSLKIFLDKLPKHEVIEAMEISVDRMNDSGEAVKYFCGVCWSKIREREDG